MGAQTDDRSKQLLRNKPDALAKLELVAGSRANEMKFYVRHPVAPGPQPILGVRTVTPVFDFSSVDVRIPKAVTRYIKELARTEGLSPEPVPLKLPQYQFTDALTVLPKETPFLKQRITDNTLRVAFSIVAAEYEQDERSYKAVPQIMSRIPQSVWMPPHFTDEQAAALANLEGIHQVLKTAPYNAQYPPGSSECNYSEADSPIFKLEVVKLHLRRWWLYNLISERATQNEAWTKHWTVLAAWHRWELCRMSFTERSAECAGDNEADLGHFISQGDALEKFCKRMTLERES